MARCRQRASVIIVAAFLANLLAQSATAFYFENYVKWANQAFKSGPTEANCNLAAVDFLDFVYALVEGAAPTVGTAQLTQACNTCSSAVDATLSLLPSNPPSTCPVLPDANSANQTVVALRRFVCFGAAGVEGGAAAAGSCVVHVVNAIRRVGLLDRIRYLDSTLRFSEMVLPELCTALWPAPPASASCCGRSWAFLMAAITQQSCLPALSQEYSSLPGRCEALLNRTVPGYCEAGWPTSLLPLLTPPPAAVCGNGSPASSSSSSSSGSSAVISWLNGSLCTTSQQLLRHAPGSACDLWCGFLAERSRIQSGEITGPQNTNITNITTSSRIPPPPPSTTSVVSRGGGDNQGGGEKLQKVTIIIVCIFSVLIFFLLLALAFYIFTWQQERRHVKREQYQFDSDLVTIGQGAPGDGKQPPPPPLVLAEPEGAGGATLTSAPPAPTDSTPPTPTPHSVSIPVDATVCAAALSAATSSITRTPRYPPGPHPAAVEATAAAARASPSSRPSNTSRALVFSGVAPTIPAGAGTGAATAAAAVEISSHRSSKYESATSLYDKATATSPGLPRYAASAGSVANLLGSEMAAEVAAVRGPASATGPRGRVRSHRLSFSGSEIATTVYQTAYSRDSASVAGTGLEPSGSYVTVRSAITGGGGSGGNGSGGANAGMASGGGGGGVVLFPGGSEGLSRTQSAGTFTALGTSPPC